MIEMWVCYTIIGILASLLIISLAFNVKSFRAFSKKYVLRWQWLWSVEERLQDAGIEAVTDAKSDSGFWKFMAVLFALLAGVILVIFAVWRLTADGMG